MKEYANNLYDIVENIAYDIERYNSELTENIPNLMDFVHLSMKPGDSSSIYSSIGFLIGKSDDIFFEHTLKVCTDILRVIERKNRILRNDVMELKSFNYSKSACNKLVSLCIDIDVESIDDFKDVDESESIKDHYNKVFKMVTNEEISEFVDVNSEELLEVFSICHSSIYNTIYDMYLKIYFRASKNTTFAMMKEIITILLYTAKFLSSVTVLE